MSKFVVMGSVEQSFHYEIVADSVEEAQKIASENAYEEFGYFDSFNIDEAYQDGDDIE